MSHLHLSFEASLGIRLDQGHFMQLATYLMRIHMTRSYMFQIRKRQSIRKFFQHFTAFSGVDWMMYVQPENACADAAG